MQVRVLTADDWSLWRELRLRALADSPDAYGRTLETESVVTEREWRARLDDRHSVNLVVETDGRPVGIGAARIRPDDAAMADIFAMWVDPSERRRGAAKALLRYALEWTRSQGARSVELTVTEGNDGAMRAYEAFGFQDTGRRTPLRETSSLQTIVMQREL